MEHIKLAPEPQTRAAREREASAAASVSPLARSARPPIAVVELDPAHLERERVVLPSAPGAVTEAYRMLRTQLVRRMQGREGMIIGITSPADGVGKTLTAINLSLAFAADPGRGAVLADFDLRHPSVARVLGVTEPRGIEACLSGDAPVSSVLMRAGGIDRFCFAQACERSTSSSELLGTPRTREVLEELRVFAGAGIVIVDLPPVLLTDDVLAIGPALDGVLIVAAEGRTQREDLARTIDLLQGIPSFGVVLNMARDAEQRAY